MLAASVWGGHRCCAAHSRTGPFFVSSDWPPRRNGPGRFGRAGPSWSPALWSPCPWPARCRPRATLRSRAVVRMPRLLINCAALDSRSPTGSASPGSPPHGVQQSTVGTEDELSDDEALTQFVFARNPPQDRPRPGDLDGLSLLRGALTANEAAGYVRRHVNAAYDDDRVRYTYVGRLRAAGFEVVAAPSKRIAIQVSVSRGAGWSDQARADFNACFIGDVDAQEGTETK